MTGDDSVTSNKTVREMETRIRELERQLGRKTLEVEILKEALDKSRLKKPTLLAQSLKPDGSGSRRWHRYWACPVRTCKIKPMRYWVLSSVALMKLSARHITASSSVFILTVAVQLYLWHKLLKQRTYFLAIASNLAAQFIIRPLQLLCGWPQDYPEPLFAAR